MKLTKMETFPFTLPIRTGHTGQQTEPVLCTELLRAIPGRRQVYDALWGERNVIVKVFCDRFKAKRHLMREWRGLQELVNRELRSPTPLFYGRTKDNRWALVTDKIVGSVLALEAFENSPNESARIALLDCVCRELAKQHESGVLQRDLHLGNFLLKGNELFLLDAGQIRFSARPITRTRSTLQLALLAFYLPTDDQEVFDRLCQDYFKVRGWEFSQADKKLLQSQATLQARRMVKRALAKCLRTSGRLTRMKTGRYATVFDKSFCRAGEARALMGQVDVLMDKGQVLKNSNTCYVCRLTWNDKDIVVKRYNHKGLWHSLRHTIKGSRARRSWLHAYCLQALRIQTPKPLAFIEKRKAGLIWTSYLVTEHVKGRKLYHYLRHGNASKEQTTQVMHRINNDLDRLHRYHITHGDLKHTNILITDDGPFLTDLDGMKMHRRNWMYRRKRAKDLKRFATDTAASERRERVTT
jgi:tRNA A-37 threonylcarbamoyl transferase component Bud32